MMNSEDALKLIENRISTTLCPKNDQIKSLFSRRESSSIINEFIVNEKQTVLFVSIRSFDDESLDTLQATFSPPTEVIN